MMRLRLFKILPGKTEDVRAWFRQLEVVRRAEAEASLVSENVTREIGAITQLNGQDYALGIMESDGNMRKADMTMSINRDHKAILEDCLDWSETYEVECLYDIAAANRSEKS